MKKPFVLVVASFAVAAAAAVNIDRIVVRQQWPWSGKVDVSYRITGVDTPVDLEVSFANGATPLVSETFATNFTGTVLGITSSGEYSFSFDPVVVFGEQTAPFDLTVALAPVASQYTAAQLTTPIYRILDLEANTWEDVTAQDLFSNRYGTYETNYVTAFAPNWTSPKLTVRDCIVWTGVTNGPTYRTSKLALRRIPAKSYGEWTMGCDKDANNTLTQRQVVLTNDFWMGVFMFTQDQYNRYMSSYGGGYTTDHDYYGSHLHLPVMNIAFASVRGDNTVYIWPVNGHDVAPSSCLGKMKTAFGSKLDFDLATEAQWEFACRGGCQAYQYNGLNSTDTAGFKDAAWTQYNSYTNAALSGNDRVNTCVPRAVGLLIPNAFGLYDMIGDYLEWVLDRYAASYTPDGDSPYFDPWGPADTSIAAHVMRSRNFKNAGMHSAFRSSGTGSAAGFRLCILIKEDE